jgi:hypothetical protein
LNRSNQAAEAGGTVNMPTSLSSVSRFYFHLHNDIDANDEEGQEFEDLNAALARASIYARDIAAENVREGKLNLSHYIEVTNEAGVSLCTVTFGDVVQISA